MTCTIILTLTRQSYHTSPALCTPITPSRSIWNDPFSSERLTMHCQWGGKPQNCPFPLGFCHPAGGGPSHCHRQNAQKIGKDRACSSGDMLADRQTDRQTHTHTEVLITILRHRSRGRSNNPVLAIPDVSFERTLSNPVEY